jgi:glycosyltransferase involved in cell wall biosynthesis
MSKLSLTVVVITLNEEKNISRCLNSVKDWASEILVVDSGSTDRTCQIAQGFGAKVIQKEWLGFGAQKNFAVSCASYDWVLNLDADEQCSEEMRSWINNHFSNQDGRILLDPKKIYSFARKSFFLGRWILRGGWYPDYQARLFNRKFAQWNLTPIHEKVEGLYLAQEMVRVASPILHYVFRDISHQVDTNNRYSSLQAELLFNQGIKSSWIKIIVKPISKFIECYLFKRGFLDGAQGFIIAYSAGYSAFLKWVKLWELERLTSEKLRD